MVNLIFFLSNLVIPIEQSYLKRNFDYLILAKIDFQYSPQLFNSNLHEFYVSYFYYIFYFRDYFSLQNQLNASFLQNDQITAIYFYLSSLFKNSQQTLSYYLKKKVFDLLVQKKNPLFLRFCCIPQREYRIDQFCQEFRSKHENFLIIASFYF